MNYLTKEEFGNVVEESYNNLTKDEFINLLEDVSIKLKSLQASNDIFTDKRSGEMVFTNKLYELNYGIFCTAFETKKISFKQYKSLCAFINKKWISVQYNDFKYKDFN
jgi:hypothetical protein